DGGYGFFVENGFAGAMQLFISDTLIHGNGNAAPNTGGGAIFVFQTTPGSASGVLNRVRGENNTSGVQLTTALTQSVVINATVRNSVISGNAGDGINVDASASLPIFVFVRNTSVVDNGGIGIDAFNGTVQMSNTTVARNGTGLSAEGGRIMSFANNEIDNNLGADGAPTGLFAPR